MYACPLHLRIVVRGTLAGFALQLHLAYTPGDAEADKTGIELAAASGLVGGGSSILAPFGHTEDVVHVEEHRELPLEEIG